MFLTLKKIDKIACEKFDLYLTTDELQDVYDDVLSSFELKSIGAFDIVELSAGFFIKNFINSALYIIIVSLGISFISIYFGANNNVFINNIVFGIFGSAVGTILAAVMWNVGEYFCKSKIIYKQLDYTLANINFQNFQKSQKAKYLKV